MTKLKRPRHERFCNEYLIDLSPADAYQRTYPKSNRPSAYQASSKLLKKVEIKLRIDELMTDLMERTRLKQEDVILELSWIGRTDIRKVMSWDKVGSGTVIASDAMTMDVARAIKKIKKTTKTTRHDDIEEETTQFEIELHDKIAALTLIGRHFGMFSDKLEVLTDLPQIILTEDQGLGSLERVDVKELTPAPESLPPGTEPEE